MYNVVTLLHLLHHLHNKIHTTIDIMWSLFIGSSATIAQNINIVDDYVCNKH